MEDRNFPCLQCGICCKNIRGISELSAYDDGTGRCIYLTKDNLCSIYINRPLVCNVDLYYEKFLKGKISKENWHEKNLEACRKLNLIF